MKPLFTHARLSASLLAPFWLLIFILFSQFATAQATVTYSTQLLPAGNIPYNATSLIYALKVVVNSDLPVVIRDVSIKTSGNYTRSDVNKFVLLQGTNASVENATSVGEITKGFEGGGETLTWGNGDGEYSVIRLEANSTNYFFVQATTTLAAAGGRTIGISGINNALTINYASPNPNPVSINNQSNRAGLQTILAPSVTYSTEPVAGASAPAGTAGNLVYILKVKVGSVGAALFNNVSIKTTGTYSGPDMENFLIYRNTSASMSGATFLGWDYNLTGAGEILDFTVPLETIPANETRYYLILAKVGDSGINGKTFGINGAGNAINIGYINNPTITNNQTDVAALQTIIGPPLIVSTLLKPAGNAAPGNSGHVLYYFQISVNPVADVSITNIALRVTGTYTTSDISSFRLLRSPVFVMDDPRSIEAALPGSVVKGHGELVSFSGSQILKKGTTMYFAVDANVALNATPGRTFGVDGSNNDLAITFDPGSSIPSVVDNQTNISGMQTVSAHSLTYSTVPLAAQNVLRGATLHPVYILKVTNGNTLASASTVTIKTKGTYSSSDISSFRLVRSNSPDMSPQTIEAGSSTVSTTGGGETLTFSMPTTLQPNAIKYYGIMANVSLNATPGRTIGIDGSANALKIDFSSPSTTLGIIDNQTDVAGIQTVFAHSLTYSTVPLAAQNVLQGATLSPVYILKVTNGDALALSSTVTIKTTGTYSGSDISSFRLFRSNSSSMALRDIEAAAPGVSATGSGETLTFSMNTNLEPNATKYYGIMANVSSNATTGRTFGIDGSANALDIDFITTSSPLNKINNQTNEAGLQTIGVSGITYSTEPLPAGTVLLGTLDHPVYTLKVTLNGDAGATLTNLETKTSGTYQADDVSSFNLYQSDKPTLDNGAENVRVLAAPIATINASAGAGEILRFGTGQVWLPAAGTTYLIITANISASGRNAKTVHINGNSSPATLRFSGAAPSPVTNNQSDAAGEQTIGNGLPVTLVSFKAKSEGNVRQLVWETSMEKDNDYFEIQRSTDAKNFVAIGQIKGSAAGFETRHYDFTDGEAISAGKIYYRLKMVDLDQTFAYSRIASVQVQGMDNAFIYPNPSSDMLYLNVTNWATVSMVRLFDLNGKIVYQSDKVPAKTIAVKKFAAGVYVVSVTDQSGSTTSQRVLLVR